MKRLLTAWIEERGPVIWPAVIRIGLAFVLWLTWGDDFTLFLARDVEMVVVAAAFYASSALMLVGLFSRFATASTGLVAGFIYYKLGVVDGNSHFVHHHTALLVIATLICALTPCGAALSVDWWRRKRRGASSSRTGPMWAVRLLGLLVSVVYFGGAISKTNLGWLSGDRLEQIFTHYYGDSTYGALPGLESLSLIATIGVVVLEYALAVGLWIPKARRWLVPLGIAMHATFYVLLPVETFSLTMVLLYLAFASRLDPAALSAPPEGRGGRRAT